MKRITHFIVLLAAMPMLMMVSCKKESAETSTVRFKLTDAPGQFDEVNVEIKAIEVHSEAEGWVTFNSNLGVINLLDYMNGKTTLLAEGAISAGKVTQARLILGAQNSVVMDGITYELQTPSAFQSGLKVNLNNQLQAGGTYEWTIDFDAAQSVVVTGNGSMILKPTLRLIVDGSSMVGATIDGNAGGQIDVGGSGGINVDTETETGTGTVVNADLTGSISGSVSTATGLAIVYAQNASGTVTSTMTDISGSFTLQAVQSGSYTITIDPVLPLISSKVISNVSVNAGATTSLGLVAL